MGVVFEVKAYNPKSREVTNVTALGWGYLPLFTTVENENKTFSLYSNSGLIQLPLYRGEVAKKKLV